MNLNSLQWVLHFLSSIGHSGQLEEVKLDVHIPGSQNGQVNWPGWEEIDCILVGAHFKFLRKVGVELWPRGNIDPGWFHEACTNLVRKLPLLGAGGIVLDVY
jgi:hypothetical protein